MYSLRRDLLKKYLIIKAIFILMAAIIFNTLFLKEKNDQYNNIVNAGQTDEGIKVILSAGNKQDDEIYGILKFYMDKYAGNIYCADIVNKSNMDFYIKYIYITNIELFKDLNLIKGRFFDITENESDKFLSTENSGEDRQLGLIEDFTGTMHFEIRTLKSGLGFNLFDRNMFLQLEDNTRIDELLNELESQGIRIIKAQESMGGGYTDSIPIITVLACSVVILLLVFYNLLNSYKKIGIEKMLGFRKADIWAKRMIPIVMAAVTAILITTGILVLICFKVFNKSFYSFLVKLAGFYGLMLIIIVIFVSIPFIYIKRISISNMLKNKNPIKAIIVFNTFIKTVLVIILLILTFDIYTRFQIISSWYANSYGNWEGTKDYAIIPEVLTKGELFNDFSRDKKQIEKELYMYFNKKGSIYANFQYFLPMDRELNQKTLKDLYKTDLITINPNYLEKNKIYSINGELVDIAETNSGYILLVPAKYRMIEKEIREYYQFLKNAYGNNEADIAKQNIEIIWIKDNQRFFSYRLDIDPQSNNCVIDPIARVLTESNGALLDYYAVLGYTGSPFKIKVDDPMNPSTSILPKIGEYYDLSRFIFPVTTIYKSVEDQIRNIRHMITFIMTSIILLMMAIAAIIIQNIANYFKQSSVRLAIKKFHGYRKLDKYMGYFVLLIGGWILAAVTIMLVVKHYESILLLTIFIFFECLISLLILSVVEKRNVLIVTKGG
jgi:putative ABC transport system permease protein